MLEFLKWQINNCNQLSFTKGAGLLRIELDLMYGGAIIRAIRIVPHNITEEEILLHLNSMKDELEAKKL